MQKTCFDYTENLDNIFIAWQEKAVLIREKIKMIFL